MSASVHTNLSEIQVHGLDAVEHITENSIFEVLKSRLLQDHNPYCLVGPLLVAVNPFGPLPSQKDGTQLEIHKVTATAIRKLDAEKKNQVIVISGESGGGKTYSANLVLSDIFQSSRSARQDLEHLLAAGQQVLEAFGNASTVNNWNSSRYSKVIKILRDGSDIVQGAHIDTYLLEKARVTHVNAGDSNFHIFHQLLHAVPKDVNYAMKLDKLPTTMLSAYRGGQEDRYRNDFCTTCQALHRIGIDDDGQQSIFSILAAILHLSGADLANVDPSVPRKSCDFAAELLGIDSDAFWTALWVSETVIRKGKEVVRSSLGVDEVKPRVDAVVRWIYERLFHALVTHINNTLASKPTGREKGMERFIGVIDIFGFENFHCNGLDQLMINSANECMQNEISDQLVDVRQTQYVSEGLDWIEIKRGDNKDLIDSLLSNAGVFGILNEQCKIKETDITKLEAGLVDKLSSYVSPKWSSVSVPLIRSNMFTIHHSVCSVEYTIPGMITQNRNMVPNNIIRLIQAAEWIGETGQPPSSTKGQTPPSSTKGQTPTSTKGPMPTTLTASFRSSLKALTELIHSCGQHYIRCLKSNKNNLPWTIHEATLKDQISTSGVLTVLKVATQLYPYQFNLSSFMARFRAAFYPEPTEISCLGEERVITELINHRDMAIGKTMVFLKDGAVRILKDIASRRLGAARTILRYLKKTSFHPQSTVYLVTHKPSPTPTQSGTCQTETVPSLVDMPKPDPLIATSETNRPERSLSPLTVACKDLPNQSMSSESFIDQLASRLINYTPQAASHTMADSSAKLWQRAPDCTVWTFVILLDMQEQMEFCNSLRVKMTNTQLGAPRPLASELLQRVSLCIAALDNLPWQCNALHVESVRAACLRQLLELISFTFTTSGLGEILYGTGPLLMTPQIHITLRMLATMAFHGTSAWSQRRLAEMWINELVIRFEKVIGQQNQSTQKLGCEARIEELGQVLTRLEAQDPDVYQGAWLPSLSRLKLLLA